MLEKMHGYGLVSHIPHSYMVFTFNLKPPQSLSQQIVISPPRQQHNAFLPAPLKN